MDAGQMKPVRFPQRVAMALAACGALAFSPLSHGAHGRTVGSAGVNSIGTATYSIPLVLPRGTNELTPQLAITYDHRMGSSPLGVGWSIAGLSTIARCVSTRVQDGASRNVRLDYNDQYCLDDQKLRLEAGTHGQAGAVYRTEVESFARVTAYGAAGSGPAYFYVERKDGLIYEYGNSADSRIESLGVATPRVWAVNKIRDRSGNAITFFYTEDVTNGGYRISSIDYATNPNEGVTTAPYHVYFNYETLPVGEISSRYLSGQLIKRLSRLDRIEVRHDTSIVRLYELSYETTLSTTARSRLQSIQECASDLNTCYSPTTFAYQDGLPIFMGQGGAPGAVPTSNILVIDINGDARSDLVYPSSATSGAGTWMYMLANSADAYDNPINSGITNTRFTEAIPIDYNADGREDFLVPYGGNTWWVVLGSAAGLSAPFNTGIPADSGPGNARAIDVTADGLEDLVYAHFDGQGGDAIYYRARELNGTFSATPATLVPPVGLDNFLRKPVFGDPLFSSRKRQPDFNGDGYADFIAKFYFFNLEVGPPQDWTEVVLGGGAGRFQVANTPNNTMYPVDLNGDGFTDLAYVASGNWTYRFSRGTSFGPSVTGPSAINYLNQNAVVIDTEGDGYEDLAARYTGNNNMGYLRSTGETLLPPQMISTSSGNSTAHYVGDINGDGQSDILFLAGSYVRYTMHAGPAPDLLHSVTDGFGNQVTFDYKPLTSTTGCYTRDSAAPAFPSKAYVGPVQVVCSMTSSDGIGGSYSLSYQYSNADMHLQGRGFLGFGKRRVVDSRNNVARFEEYSSDYAAYERLGVLTKETVRQSTTGPVISETVPTWSRHTYGAGTNERRYPYVSQSVTRQYEVGGTYNGALLRTATTVNSVQSTTGTIYDTTTTTVEGSTANGVQASASYAQRVYLPTANILTDTSNWCLGRPQRVETTGSHTQYGGGAVTRTQAINWDAAKCRPTDIVTEPGQGAPLQVTRVLGYDAFGNINTDTVTGSGMLARTTTVQWDTAGRFPESVTNALSQTTSFDWYESTGLPMSQTDPNGLTISWLYDAMGRRTRETRPDGTKTTWTYELCVGCANSTGKTLVTETELDVNNAVITDRRVYADAFDRRIAVSDRSLSGAYTRVERKYDIFGRVVQEGAPCWWTACTQYWTDIAYDSINRPIAISRPLSDSIPTPQTSYIYYEGLTTRRVDALGKQTTHIANAIGALARSTDHAGYYQQFDYDGSGNAVRVVDSLGATLVSNVFNVRGMRTAQTELSSTGTSIFTPNALGEVVSQTSANGGAPTTFEYDLLGRLKKRIEPEGTSEWIWGTSAAARNIGQLATMTGPGYSESYLYDTLGRMQRTTIVSDATYHVDYAYNTAGMLHTLIYPTSTSGYRLQLLYEYQNGHLLSVKDANATSTAFWSASATDAQGNIVAEALGNGMQTIRGYDSVTGLLDYLDSGSGAIQDLSYSWDAVGNLTERRDERQGLTEGFQYDDLYRLTASTGPDPIDLDYDPRGNLIFKSGNANNVRSGVNHTVTYTSYNLPNTISRLGGDASQFYYAPDRSRWKQAATYGGTAETTVYIGNLIEKVTVGTNVLWRHYIAGGTGPVAVYTRKSSGTNEIHYLTRDHLGSVDSVSNAAGAVEVRTAFGAFGQRRQESGWNGNLTSADWAGVASTSRRGYTFHEALDNLNLTHMNGRVYDQVTGRFLSPDPLVQAPGFTQSFNRYAYTFNNPLSYTDPSGYGASNADGAADSAAALGSAAYFNNPITAVYQLFRLWSGFGNAREEWRLIEKRALDKLLPPFDPVPVPRTANTDAGEPVGNDPAAGFKGMPSTVGGTQILNTITAPWGGWDDFKYAVRCTWECDMPGNGSLEANLAALPFLPIGVEGAAAGSLTAIRATYLRSVDDLVGLGLSMRAAGTSAEQAARLLVPLRNQLKLDLRVQGSWFAARTADVRNLVRYGNRAGPTADDLYRQYGSWDKVLDALGRTNTTVDTVLGVGR